MADNEKNQGNSFNFSGLVVASSILAAAVFIHKDAPLDVPRPAISNENMYHGYSDRSVEARLWEDPFAAVQQKVNNDPTIDTACAQRPGSAASKAANQKLSAWSHTENLGKDFENFKRKPIKVLIASISGAAYAANAEIRRRTRYAILAGLDVKKYKPVDHEHIDYFTIGCDQKEASKKNTPDRLETDKGFSFTSSQPLRVPYEWFEPDENENNKNIVGNKSSEPQNLKPYILLLWLDEDYLQSDALDKSDDANPVNKIQKIIDELKERSAVKNLCNIKKNKLFDFIVIGPETSDIRNVLARDLDPLLKPNEKGLIEKRKNPDSKNNNEKLKEVKFYSYAATAKCDLGICDKNNGYFYHTLPDDYKLAKIIHDELKNRGIEPSNGRGSIAFISEWDTVYGRKIVESMKKALGIGDCESENSTKGNDTNNHNKKCFERFYSRGLDGAIVPERKKNKGLEASSGNGVKSLIDDNQRAGVNTPYEVPTGPSQYDYMRRLAEDLKREDEELRRNDPEKSGIKAIGVFGNDSYDKLVALRALKPDFPEAVFFTTDYDAALQVKDQTPYTRNLLIASGFGPTLGPDYQKNIPPFRSVYQTSAFYATLLAIVGKEPDPAVDNPVIFEIDRNGRLIQLKTPKREKDITNNLQHSANNPEAYKLRPDILPLYPQFSEKRRKISGGLSTGLGIFILGILLFLYKHELLRKMGFIFHYFISKSLAGNKSKVATLEKFEDQSKEDRKIFMTAETIFLILALVIFGLICLRWDDVASFFVKGGEGEPLIFTGGVSIWSTVLCRAIAIALSIWLIYRAQSRLQENIVDIQKKIILDKCKSSNGVQSNGNSKCMNFKYIKNYFEFIADFFDKNQSNFKKEDLTESIKVYNSFEAPLCKLLRVGVFSLLLTLLFCFALDSFGMGEPSLRDFDNTHDIFKWTLYIEVFFVSALCMYVIDSVLLCLAFIEDIAKTETLWPNDCTREVIKELGFRKQLSNAEYKFIFERDQRDLQIVQSIVDLVFIEGRTRCVLPLVYSPFFVIALTVFSRSNAFDAYPTCWVAILGEALAVALIFLCAHSMNRQATIVQEKTLEKLENAIVRARAAEMNPQQLRSLLATSSQLQDIRNWVANLHQGAFSPPLQQPLFRGLIMPFAGLGLNLMANYGWLPIV